MTAEEIIAKVKSLDLPTGSYVVFGSCPMTIAGLREANDIDLVVSPEVMAKFEKAGWKRLRKNENDVPLVRDVFEIHDSWSFSAYKPTLQTLQATATLVEGVPFASLEEVRKWKAAARRPKDLDDVKLIDQYRK